MKVQNFCRKCTTEIAPGGRYCSPCWKKAEKSLATHSPDLVEKWTKAGRYSTLVENAIQAGAL